MKYRPELEQLEELNPPSPFQAPWPIDPYFFDSVVVHDDGSGNRDWYSLKVWDNCLFGTQTIGGCALINGSTNFYGSATNTANIPSGGSLTLTQIPLNANTNHTTQIAVYSPNPLGGANSIDVSWNLPSIPGSNTFALGDIPNTYHDAAFETGNNCDTVVVAVQAASEGLLTYDDTGNVAVTMYFWSYGSQNPGWVNVTDGSSKSGFTMGTNRCEYELMSMHVPPGNRDPNGNLEIFVQAQYRAPAGNWVSINSSTILVHVKT